MEYDRAALQREPAIKGLLGDRKVAPHFGRKRRTDRCEGPRIRFEIPNPHRSAVFNRKKYILLD